MNKIIKLLLYIIPLITPLIHPAASSSSTYNIKNHMGRFSKIIPRLLIGTTLTIYVTRSPATPAIPNESTNEKPTATGSINESFAQLANSFNTLAQHVSTHYDPKEKKPVPVPTSIKLEAEPQKNTSKNKPDLLHTNSNLPESNPILAKHDKKKEKPKSEAPEPSTPEPQPQINTQKNKIDLSKASNPPHSSPILAKHKKFSNNWWNALFNPCKGCEKKDANKQINCEKLLAQNPQWKEVKSMSQQVKNIITRRALKKFRETGDACNLACSLCVGGDPDTEAKSPCNVLTCPLCRGVDPKIRAQNPGECNLLSGEAWLEVFRNCSNQDLPYTILFASAEKNYSSNSGLPTNPHYGIFNLSLRKGANPNLESRNLWPLEFNIPESWKRELRQYDAKDPAICEDDFGNAYKVLP